MPGWATGSEALLAFLLLAVVIGGLRRWWLFSWVHEAIVELYKRQLSEKDVRISELKRERDEAVARAFTATQTAEHQAGTLRAVVQKNPTLERLDEMQAELEALKDENR